MYGLALTISSGSLADGLHKILAAFAGELILGKWIIKRFNSVEFIPFELLMVSTIWLTMSLFRTWSMFNGRNCPLLTAVVEASVDLLFLYPRSIERDGVNDILFLNQKGMYHNR